MNIFDELRKRIERELHRPLAESYLLHVDRVLEIVNKLEAECVNTGGYVNVIERIEKRICNKEMDIVSERAEQPDKMMLRLIGKQEAFEEVLSIIREEAEKEVSKHKVTELEMIVELIGDKPYYSIRYFDIADMRWHIGYSSYDLKNVVEWKKECFEVVGDNGGWIPCSERLPENVSPVIVQVKEEMENPTIGWYGNMVGWKLLEECFNELNDFTVIAWQPLPAPYQKGE